MNSALAESHNPVAPRTIDEGLADLEQTFTALNVQVTTIALHRAGRTIKHVVDENPAGIQRTVEGVYTDTRIVVSVGSPMPPDVNARLQAATTSAAAAASLWTNSGASSVTMLGSSLTMRHLDEAISRVARSRHIVLITGESGTGKTTAAQLIHDRSQRAPASFVDVNCAAIPDTLIESELFGYEKGAFTGAITTKKGLFELAEGGTLFLDEIGELKLDLQAKLLKAIEQKKVRRLGGTRDIPCNVRILAASSRDLQRMLKTGTFREDLYYRLAVLEIEIPALRDRQDDISELVSNQLAVEQETCAFEQPLKFDPRALNELVNYSWPGNIRQLFNVLARLACHTPTRCISLAHVRSELARFRKVDPDTIPLPDSCCMLLPGESLSQFSDRTRDALFQAVKEFTNGNMSRAAQRLDVDRASMFRIMERIKVRQAKTETEPSQGEASIAA